MISVAEDFDAKIKKLAGDQTRPSLLDDEQPVSGKSPEEQLEGYVQQSRKDADRARAADRSSVLPRVQHGEDEEEAA